MITSLTMNKLINSEQEEIWNGRLGEGFLKVEKFIDATVEPFSKIAIEKVNAKEGDKILDIGCGHGSTSISLAKSGAKVIGIDISEKMISRAKEKSSNIPNISFYTSDAAVKNFEKEYNHVFSRFGVMFFSDPYSAFSNIFSGITNKGKITFLCWQDISENDWINCTNEVLKPFQPEQTTPIDPRSPGGFSFSDKEYVFDILKGSGFSNIEINPLNTKFDMGKSIDEIMSFHLSIGPLSGLMENLDDDTSKEVIRLVRVLLEGKMEESGLHLDAAAWLVTAESK